MSADRKTISVYNQHQGQLSLPSLGVSKQSTSLLGKVCSHIGWQVIWCDPTWQVTLCSCEIGNPMEPYTTLTSNLLYSVK